MSNQGEKKLVNVQSSGQPQTFYTDSTLLQFFEHLPTNYLLCACRLACPKWQRVLQNESAMTRIWKQRANFYQQKCTILAHQTPQAVPFIEQPAVPAAVDTADQFENAMARCEHYYRNAILHLAKLRLFNSAMLSYYQKSLPMEEYWCDKHGRAARQGEIFNEVDTEWAIKTVSENRHCARSFAINAFNDVKDISSSRS